LIDVLLVRELPAPGAFGSSASSVSGEALDLLPPGHQAIPVVVGVFSCPPGEEWGVGRDLDEE
jgi:hypothetical protein